MLAETRPQHSWAVWQINWKLHVLEICIQKTTARDQVWLQQPCQSLKKYHPDHHHLHWEKPHAWMRRNTWTKAKKITTGFLVWIQWAAWMDSLPRYQQCTGGGWACELKVGSPVKSHRKKTNSFCTIFQSNKLFRRTWFTSLLGKKK